MSKNKGTVRKNKGTMSKDYKAETADNNIKVTFNTNANNCDISKKAINFGKQMQDKINTLFTAVDPAHAESMQVDKNYVLFFFDAATAQMRKQLSQDELYDVAAPMAMLKASFMLCMLVESDCMPKSKIDELKQVIGNTSFTNVKAFNDSFMKTVEPYIDKIKFNMCTIGNTIYGLNELLVDMVKGQPNNRAAYATVGCMSLLAVKFASDCGMSNVAKA